MRAKNRQHATGRAVNRCAAAAKSDRWQLQACVGNPLQCVSFLSEEVGTMEVTRHQKEDFETTEITEFHGKKLQDKQTSTVRSSPTHSAFPVPFSRRSRSILVLILILLVIFFLIVIVVVILICLREANSPSPLRTTHPSRAHVSEQMSESEKRAFRGFQTPIFSVRPEFVGV